MGVNSIVEYGFEAKLDGSIMTEFQKKEDNTRICWGLSKFLNDVWDSRNIGGAGKLKPKIQKRASSERFAGRPCPSCLTAVHL